MSDPIDPVLPLNRWPIKTRKIAFGAVKTGYKVNPENPLEVIPDVDQIVWIEKAFDYLQAGSSLREVCDWLGQKLHRSIVHQTVNNLYNQHRKPFTFHKTEKKKGFKHDRATKKLIAEKTKAAAQIKRVKALEAKKKLDDKKLKSEDFDSPREARELPTRSLKPSPDYKVDIAFSPNPGPQEDFLASVEPEILFGGSAGGGKSYAMLGDPMRYFHNGNFVGLLIRRTNDELKQLIRESHKIYPKAFPGAEFKIKDSAWKFPSGAELWMSYLDRDEDVQRYQGQEFCWIGIDELTHYATPFAWTYLRSRLRTTDPELKPYLCMRASTNPGGPGHQWVKKMFIDPAPPNTAFWATDIDTGEVLRYPENYHDPLKAGKPLFKRRFIPSRLSDNPYLYEDGIYEASLLSLPEDQRRKLLEGDWTINEGAAFSEFRQSIHVTEPFEIPESWRRFRSGDFGYSSNSAVLWFAIDPTFETLIVYRELYVSKKTGIELADMVIKAEANESVSYGVLDSSVWHQRGHYGPSIAEEMIQRGCRWRPSDRGDGSRIAGRNRLHELLKVNPDIGKPGIIFFNTCRQVIGDLPMIPTDPNGGEDIDDRYKSDHTYDALRYGIMSRPRSVSALDWGSKPTQNYHPVDKIFGY